MSTAKESEEHYFVKDRRVGYLCRLCGVTGMDVGHIKETVKCSPTLASPGMHETNCENDAAIAQELAAAELHDMETEDDFVLQSQLLALQQEEQELAQLLELQQLLEQEKILKQQQQVAVFEESKARQRLMQRRHTRLW